MLISFNDAYSVVYKLTLYFYRARLIILPTIPSQLLTEITRQVHTEVYELLNES